VCTNHFRGFAVSWTGLGADYMSIEISKNTKYDWIKIVYLNHHHDLHQRLECFGDW